MQSSSGQQDERSQLRQAMIDVAVSRHDVVVQDRDTGPVFRCLIHSQTDCSPMLNGCSVVTSAAREVQQEISKKHRIEEIPDDEDEEPANTKELLGRLTKREDESQTEFAIRCIKAEGWLEGHAANLRYESVTDCPYL